MKSASIMTIIGVCAVGLTCTAAKGEPVGAAFTYQGQLKDGGVPINGLADFHFTLWDMENEGSSIASEGFEAVQIDNGLFSVELNFGATAFTGEARWLEIAVAYPTGEGGWTTLTPRQPLTPAPYALYALSGAGGSGGESHWSLNGNHIYNNNSGKVGIGTSNPEFTLEVYDSGNIGTPPTTLGLHWKKLIFPDPVHDWFYFAVGGGLANMTSGTRWVREAGTDLHFQTQEDYQTGLPSTQMVLDAGGRIGIGTSNPQSPLHVKSPGGIDLILEADTDNSGEADNARVVFKQDGAQVVGRVGYRHTSNAFEIMQEYNSSLILGTSNADAMTIDNEGKVGIGRSNPDANLDVMETASETLAKFTQLGTGQGVRITMTNPSNSNPTLIVQGANHNVPSLEVSGTASVDVLQITGADVAEKFPVSEAVEPGMVVVIDPDRPGQLRPSRTAYDRRVAGVVSGANGLPAGTILGHLPGLDDAPPIALTGRVWVNCDATGHAIEVGNMLTTSNTPGHAMNVTDYTTARGAIIGKAMTPLKEGRGPVLVLVSLQ